MENLKAKKIQVWDTQTCKLLSTINIGDDEVQSVAMSSDGKRIVSDTIPKSVQVWDAQTGKAIPAINIGESANHVTFNVALSSDGKILVSGSNKQIHI